MTTDQRKVQLGIGVDATEARAGFQDVKDAARDMAQGVAQAGQEAAKGVDSIGTGAGAAAQKVDQTARSITDSIKRIGTGTAESSQAVKNWNDVHNAAMAKASADWREYKEALKGGASPPTEGLRTWKEFHDRGMADARAQWAAYKASAQAAAAAVAQSSDAAISSSDRLTSNQSRLLESLKRQSVQLTEGKSAWLEMRAAQLGVSQAADPYIQKIRAAERVQNDLGMSAKQTAAALRGVPAQFTDIFTSLAAGQAPITVLLQQGGQLKDMFGGTGAAARALGGYIVGLINPFTVLAAAAGAVALAYYQGSKEADAYNRALIMTGNVAGTTAGQMAGMAERIGDVVGTQGKAAEALAAMAGTGRVAAGSLEYFSRVAVQMERTVGKSIEETAKEFAELGKAPVEASERLNQQYRYLTASVWEQIKALQEQGRTEEAAAAAQNAYADAMNGRTKQLEANLGHLESLWKAVGDSAKGAWDAMLNVGRADSLAEQIEEQRKVVEEMWSGERNGNVAIAQQYLKTLEDRAAAEKRTAQATAEARRQDEARIGWLKEGDKYLSKAVQMEREITKARNEGAAAGATVAEIEQRIGQIREKYAEKSGGRGGKSAAEKAAEEAKKMVEAGKELAAALLAQDAGLSGDFYKKWDSLSAAYQAGAIGADRLTQAQAELLSQQPAIAAIAKADEARAAAMGAMIESETRRAQALAGNVDKMREELVMLGASPQALAYYAASKLDAAAAAEELAAANLNEAAATGEAAGASAEAVAYYRQLAEARTDAARALREQSGMTLEKAQKQASIDAANAAEQEWKRTAESIEQSLTDALLRGFESGEDFAENFRNTLKNMFATLVLRPIIQPIAQGMSGTLLQAVGIGGGGVGGAGSGGGSSPLSLAQNAYSLYGNSSILAQYAAGSMSGANALGTMYANATGTGLDGLVGATGGWGTAPYSPGMGTYGAGLAGALWAYNQTGSYTAGVAGGAAGMAGAGAIAGGMGAAAAGTSVGAGAMAGASAGLAAIPVWGWAALAVLAIAGDLMQDKKDPKVAFQMAKQGGGFDKNWEDGVKVSSVFGELGLNANSKDVDAKYFRKSLEAIATFDSAMAAFLDAREIEAVRARMDGWKSTRVDAKYAAGGQRERLLAITEGIGGDVFADAQAFVDSGQAKGNKGVRAFTQYVMDRIRTDELSDMVGTLGASLSDDAAMAWMQSLNRTETVTNAKGKNEKVQISGFNEIAAATQQLQAVVGMDAGDALAAQVKAMVMQFDALGASMPTSIDGFKALIGGIDLTTAAGQKLYMQLAPLAAGFGQLQVAQQQLYDMLVPESEKLARAQTELAAKFADLGVAVPQGADTLRTLIDAQDQSTEAGRTMRAELLALVPAFKGVTDAAQEAGRAWEALRADLTKFRNEITGGALAGLSPESAYIAAQTQFEQTSRLAAIGNQDALAALSDVGRSFLDASREYFASGASYFADLASVQGVVDAGLSLTDRKLAAIAGGVDMPAFADGGFHAGGLRLVGEEGAEIEATGPARYWTAEQTRGFLSGDRSQAATRRDQEIIDELKVVVRVLSAGMSALDERLARLERSGNEQARQARMTNDRRVA